MKTTGKFLVFVLAAVGMCSCFDEYQAKPQIQLLSNVYCTHSDGSRDSTAYFGDTLLVGDTARVWMAIKGISHPLKMVQVTSADTAALVCGFECDSDFIAVCLEKDSKPEEGYLHFVSSYTMVGVKYRYVAKKTGTYSMNFVVESLAKEGYNHNEEPVTQTIR